MTPKNTLIDDETWTSVLDAALSDDPGAAEVLARLLLYLKEAIELRPEGAASAVNTLMEGIHLVYPYTTAFALPRKLWVLSLEGLLTLGNEPDSLISAALQMGWKETTVDVADPSFERGQQDRYGRVADRRAVTAHRGESAQSR